MTRPLLFSEQQTLTTLISPKATTGICNVHVIEENFSKPRTKGSQWFNTDFMLQFIPTLPRQQKFAGGAYPIRRSSMGAEFFLILDSSAVPLRLELLNGESIPISSYKTEVRWIESTLNLLGINYWPQGIKTAEFLRVFDFEECVIFLASNTCKISAFSLCQPIEFTSETARIQTRRQNDNHIIEGILYRK